MEKWKLLSSEYLYQDNWFTARKDICQKPDGGIVNPYYVLEYPNWVTGLAITTDNEVVLVKQYRHALGEVMWEVPGGCVDKEDENYEAAIRRELLEETGYEFGHCYALGRISPNPSTNNNWMYMFLLTDGILVQEQSLDPNETIEVGLHSFEQVEQLLAEQAIKQALHVTTLYYGLQKWRSLQ